MSHGTIQRPALGQWADLGALYDARTDTFVQRSLLAGPPPETTVSATGNFTRQLQFLPKDGYKDRFNHLTVNIDVAASFLSGMLNVAGAAEYLKDTRNSNLVEQASIQYVMTTVEENLVFGSPELRSYISLASIMGSGATHVLAAIGWGVRTIVTAKYQSATDSERQTARDQIEHEFQRIDHIISSGGQNTFSYPVRHQSGNLEFDVRIYSDVLPESRRTADLHHACNFFLELPSGMAAINGGKGLPLTYTLITLDTLGLFLNVAAKPDITFSPPSINYLEGFLTFFDELRDAEQRLNDYCQEITGHGHCVPPQYIEAITRSLNRSSAAGVGLRSNLARVLKDVRGHQADQSELLQLLDGARQQVISSKDITDLTNRYLDKIEFVNRVMASDINYFGYGAESIETALLRNNVEDAYVLYFNDKLRLEGESWDENYNLLQQCQKKDPNCVVAIVDCDAAGVSLDQVRISRFQRGKQLVPDVLHQVKYGKCFARYISEEELDTDAAKKPLRRSAVKIACPGTRCDKSLELDWVCYKCNVPIEYGAADQYIYCECGRSTYTNYGFRCKGLEHGKIFERFEKSMLLQLLNSLDPMDELNILIIGETGVGKSTFINAFINYLTYDTLDEAMENEQLDWVIPCSFNYQTIDNGGFKQTKIQVGHDKDEIDGSGGESATQRTMVYPVTLGDTVVRLIDTPGIGDTRGVEMDKQNMANILGMLRNFDKLHGILFLLKSNNSRLNLMFRFVMEELLTHLHRDAALNMVFGFTNTRISNYMPGDTLGPLEKLLKKHERVHITLSPRTVYCFDSESFRFLAAQKSGLMMENLKDFQLSWEKSRRETKRLIQHFGSLAPHAVRQTVSLNQTRELILHLTRPMADIMQIIDKSIQLNMDNVQELTNTRLRGDQLRQRLNWEQIVLVHHSLDHPRTVCNDIECKEFRDDGAGTRQTIYKSHCHRRCYLTGIELGTVSCAALRHCAAFDGKENCGVCGHHWENHLHVNHELEEQRRTVENPAIVDQLAKNASDIILKETAIQNLKDKIAESDYEYKEILDAAVKFGVFLKKHSITPYNDVMEDYLKHLIKEEEGKVSVGGSPERLQNLQQHLHEHVEQVKVLSQNMQGDSEGEILDEAGVESLVDHLYQLKHWGKNLRDIKNRAEEDFLAEYQERPFRPARNLSSKSPSSSSWSSVALGWITDTLSTGMSISEPRRRTSTRVASPYQSRTSMPSRSAAGNHSIPGAYPAVDASRSAMMGSPKKLQRRPPPISEARTSIEKPSPPPQKESPPPQPTRPSPSPQAEQLPPPPPNKLSSTSIRAKFLRPFTKRF